MSAETLRRAASRMRTYASEATPGPWVNRRGPGEHVLGYDMGLVADVRSREDRRYIASMHPEVALAVADWLEDQLNAFLHVRPGNHLSTQKAVAVARAYLGEGAE